MKVPRAAFGVLAFGAAAISAGVNAQEEGPCDLEDAPAVVSTTPEVALPPVSLDPELPDPDPGTYPRADSTRILKPGEIEIFAATTGRARGRLYNRGGRLNPRLAKKLDRVFRSHKGRRRHIHRRLYSILYVIAQHYRRPIQIISGYRPPKHRRRRRHGKRRHGSRHGMGRAADIRVVGVPPIDVAHFIKGHFEKVGVGYYPTSLFVHVDVRKQSYYWYDRSGPGERNRTTALEVDRKPRRGSDWTVKTRRLPKALRPPARKKKKKKKGKGKKKGRGQSPKKKKSKAKRH